MRLDVRDQVPHFDIVDVDGRRVAYRELWQRRHLLLILLPDDPRDDADYRQALATKMSELSAYETAVVITRMPVDGAPRPGVVVADRWGEIQWIAGGDGREQLPPVSEIVEWLRFVQMQCPECQGETR
jgi:hypothetical protein